MIRLVVMASGTGSNFGALVRAIEQGRCRAQIAGMVTDRKSAGALEIAQASGIPTKVVPFTKRMDRDRWNIDLAAAVRSFDPALVVLAGFMRVLGSPMIESYPNRIVNVHPSLLPSFPGVHAVRQALRAGARITGCTVHYVDSGVDTGPILAQAAVPAYVDDTEDSLHARIRVAEHRLLPSVVHWIGSQTAASRSQRPDRDSAAQESALLFNPPVTNT